MPRLFQFGLLALMAIAAVLRFTHLDGKLLGSDEATALLWLSGTSGDTIYKTLYTGQTVTASAFAPFQSLNPQHSVVDVVKAIATDAPQVGPLYFILLYFWAKIFGTGLAALRSFSGILSLLAWPAAYWLGREWLGRSITGWALAALVATSPFYAAYSQTALPTSLWLLLILVNSAAFWQAVRGGGRLPLILYAVSAGLGLYASPLHTWVLLAQGLFLGVEQRGHSAKNSRSAKHSPPAAARRAETDESALPLAAFGLAVGAAVVSFLPWVLTLIGGWATISRSTAWLAKPLPGGPLALIQRWANNFQLIWLDTYELLTPERRSHLVVMVLLPLMVLGLVAAGSWLFSRWGSRRAGIFAAWLGLLPLGAALLPDLLGGQRSAQIAQLLPSVVALQLLAAGALTVLLVHPRLESWRRWGQLGAIALVLVGVLSFGRSLKSNIWWTQGFATRSNPEITAFLKTQPEQVVVSDRYPDLVFALAATLPPSQKFRLVVPWNLNQQVTAAWLKDLGKTAVFYRPSDRLKAHLDKLGWKFVRVNLKPKYKSPWLEEIYQPRKPKPAKP